MVYILSLYSHANRGKMVLCLSTWLLCCFRVIYTIVQGILGLSIRRRYRLDKGDALVGWRRYIDLKWSNGQQDDPKEGPDKLLMISILISALSWTKIQSGAQLLELSIEYVSIYGIILTLQFKMKSDTSTYNLFLILFFMIWVKLIYIF